MTDARIALAGMAELADKGPDVDMLRQMVRFMAQRLMDMDVESLCGAGYDEKSAERLNSRNGFRDRSWETRTGTVALKIPKLRQGSYFSGFLEPRRTAEKALAALSTGPMTYSEWKKAAQMSDSTFRRRRDELSAAGKIEQIGPIYRIKKP